MVANRDSPQFTSNIEAVLFVIPPHLPYIEKSVRDVLSGRPYVQLRVVASGFGYFNRRRLVRVVGAESAGIPIDFTRAQNIGANRNYALASSKYDFVAFLDADDRFHPQFGRLLQRSIDLFPSLDIFVHGFHFGVREDADVLWRENHTHRVDINRSQFTPVRGEPSFPVHKGHMMVARRYGLDHLFDTSLLKREEDSEYFASAISQNALIVASPQKTTVWRGGSSAFFPGVRLAYRLYGKISEKFSLRDSGGHSRKKSFPTK